MVIHLTPVQRIGLFGAMNPQPMLHWLHIQHGSTTLDRCIQYGVSAQELHDSVQPCIEQWLLLDNASRPTAQHVTYMLPWPLHPIDHLGLSFVDTILLRLPVQTMLGVGLDFDAMVGRHALNADAMRLARRKWRDWVLLGVTREFVLREGPEVMRSAFGVHMEEALATCAR
jgi:hypothetical protein